MAPSIEEVYSILRKWGIDNEPHSYTDLSVEYQQQTGKWLEPHGSWDNTLGVINNILAEINAPALSAVVIYKDGDEPGRSFWGSAPNVPERPQDDLVRLAEWNRILKDIKQYDWPELLP
ncbi:hypothetical protein [Desulfogranum marinum]|uniref:hypothetical protein n=1 Tax=Desulfogranum marinum TaxID=453220 RepID=UPI0019630A20|nr:hypothetical protein [Desulfogranum marinum]MBM9514698.1 hypothetical protein [Desulfogranum marinum]